MSDTPTTEPVKPTVEVKISMDLQMPVEDIECLIEMAGFGINYWASKAVVDGEAMTYTVTESDSHDEDKPVTKTLAYADIARVLLEIASGKYEVGYPREHAQQYLTTLQAGDPDAGVIDSDIGDVVIQIAMFGELVYG
jgi:hypothetical protein